MTSVAAVRGHRLVEDALLGAKVTHEARAVEATVSAGTKGHWSVPVFTACTTSINNKD